MTSLQPPPPVAHVARTQAIAQAREALLDQGQSAPGLVAPWVTRSWQRCLQYGLVPQDSAEFAVVTPAHSRRTSDDNHHLMRTAKPWLEKLGRAIVDTRYFVILTNQDGVVVDVSGPIDRHDRRADLITRIGTDLSERSMGTTAIGAALSEKQPVWLHRGEHFFDNTTVYSCAGAPVFGPRGECRGMLDVTGIDAIERPELGHLVTQMANKIGNALVLAEPHSLLLRMNWPGNALGSDADGMVCLDADGWITAANAVARQLVPDLQTRTRVHADVLFGLPLQMLFDAARRSHYTLELPLWSGLRLHAKAVQPDREALQPPFDPNSSLPQSVGLKDLETALIHKAVEQARGNVAQAALALGISRATVYRKLGRRPPP